jgi:histidine ammonia-lyase
MRICTRTGLSSSTRRRSIADVYATGQAALLLYDAREALSWADLTYAVDLSGMNSSTRCLPKAMH